MNGRQLTIKALRRKLEQENAKLTSVLSIVPRSEWPDTWEGTSPPVRVWRSKRFLVQEFNEADGVVRLSCIRSMLGPDGHWLADISWDEIQVLKAEAGYGNRDAVEIYPPDWDLVRVANMRHLWVLPYKLPFVWRKK
ncbi:hypothetical protein [Herbaspirillum sp.]|uniref:DUF7694 domain-containing protein n=1 Tax=Herbaspirillum sp. TaxID=1890675 RepID=UPI000C0AE421|nr:hypothetical protein [Herbaspirillum sp.]MAF05117.1 hypothetical protein [Herbaspirillum sp.]